MTTNVSRRRFLQGLASLGLLARGGLVALPACSEPALTGLDELERRLPGKVLKPGAEGFSTFTSPWNLHWSGRRPVASAVVRAASPADVQAALKWARETATPIVARSGGHSYSGYSTTSGVVIDVSSMTRVVFDPARNQATVEGGARNTHVYAELAKVNRTVTHGRCFQVGVAGLVLGGGVGFNMRRIGLTCDQLAGTDVVLASGDTARADSSQNPDLYWAARGAGGGQLGIHTSFTFDTHPAPDLVVFDLTFRTRVDELLPKLLAAAQSAPRALGLKFNLRVTAPGGANTIVLNLLGQWAGPKAELDAWLAPLLAIASPDPSVGFLVETPYWKGQSMVSDEGKPELMYERSRYALRAIPEAALAEIVDRLRRWPATSAAASWKGFLTGGAVSDKQPADTAFVHRRDWLLTTSELNWTAADEPSRVLASLEWLDSLHDFMAAHTSAESYQNFIDDSQRDWARAYHGANLERLVEIKRKYDPDNVFSFPQSLPLTVPG